MGTCKRRGHCCQDVRLAESPEILETAYTYWRKSKSIDPSYTEIYLIYPMLTFLFEEKDADLPYHYRCKHFTHDETGLPTCSIHPIRPAMCRDFPYYKDQPGVVHEGPISPYEGCGYND
jgi:Fe-S-cluster containining protein